MALTVKYTGQFQGGMLEILRGYQRLMISDRCKTGEESNSYYHEEAERLADPAEFFGALSDMLQAAATAPLPYSLGLNGNPDLLLAALPTQPFRFAWSRSTGPAGRGIRALWEDLTREHLPREGLQHPEHLPMIVAVGRHPDEFSDEFFEEVLTTFDDGLSCEEMFADYAEQLANHDPAQGAPRRRRLVGFFADARLRGRIRLSVWAFTENIQQLRRKEGANPCWDDAAPQQQEPT